jgi:hypothetical protein
MNDDIFRRFYTALPHISGWIDEFLNDHAAQSQAVCTLGFTRLSASFSQEFLERAKVVTVASVPFPPVAQFGIPELAPIQQMSFAGITYKDTFFLQQGQSSESLHFHELVHVVQWERLGVDNFLLAYGVGLVQFGYKHSPLEQMAYSLQQAFDNNSLPEDLISFMERRTDAIWADVAPVLKAIGGA